MEMETGDDDYDHCVLFLVAASLETRESADGYVRRGVYVPSVSRQRYVSKGRDSSLYKSS